MSAGWKRAGSTNVDARGNVDSVQFINGACSSDLRTSYRREPLTRGKFRGLTFPVAKDDALAYPEVRQRTYPSAVNDRMSTVTDFIRTSDAVLQTLMEALEPRIGLPKGTLAALHKEGDISGSESRVILKGAPGDKHFRPEGTDEDGNPAAAIGFATFLPSFLRRPPSGLSSH